MTVDNGNVRGWATEVVFSSCHGPLDMYCVVKWLPEWDSSIWAQILSYVSLRPLTAPL